MSLFCVVYCMVLGESSSQVRLKIDTGLTIYTRFRKGRVFVVQGGQEASIQNTALAARFPTHGATQNNRDSKIFKNYKFTRIKYPTCKWGTLLIQLHRVA